MMVFLDVDLDFEIAFDFMACPPRQPASNKAQDVMIVCHCMILYSLFFSFYLSRQSDKRPSYFVYLFIFWGQGVVGAIEKKDEAAIVLYCIVPS